MSKEKYEKHGFKNIKKTHPLYVKLCNMKARCYNEKSDNFTYYGGRGITVCKEWLKSYKDFIEWGLKNGWKEGLEIDRINTNGNYEPKNVRFVNRSINVINSRKRKSNTSGYVGVKLNSAKKKWTMRIVYNNTFFEKGGFLNKKDALKARNLIILLFNLPHKIQEYKGEGG